MQKSSRHAPPPLARLLLRLSLILASALRFLLFLRDVCRVESPLSLLLCLLAGRGDFAAPSWIVPMMNLAKPRWHTRCQSDHHPPRDTATNTGPLEQDRFQEQRCCSCSVLAVSPSLAPPSTRTWPLGTWAEKANNRSERKDMCVCSEKVEHSLVCKRKRVSSCIIQLGSARLMPKRHVALSTDGSDAAWLAVIRVY